jgi:hypothetical protein
MRLLLCVLMTLFVTISKALSSHQNHLFETLNTVTDLDFAPLMSGDWMQRLPEEVRNYRY